MEKSHSMNEVQKCGSYTDSCHCSHLCSLEFSSCDMNGPQAVVTCKCENCQAWSKLG